MDAESVRSEMKGVNHKNWQYWRTLSEPLNKSVGSGAPGSVQTDRGSNSISMRVVQFNQTGGSENCIWLSVGGKSATLLRVLGTSMSDNARYQQLTFGRIILFVHRPFFELVAKNTSALVVNRPCRPLLVGV